MPSALFASAAVAAPGCSVPGATPGPDCRQHLARVLQQGAGRAVVCGPAWSRHDWVTQRCEACVLFDAVMAAVVLDAWLEVLPLEMLHG